ncbi:MAG: hypothetical protein P4L49_02415 [Desulfosporosinus sp.]|nr:hypothetical protein [Desulfosporosinus sp.]
MYTINDVAKIFDLPVQVRTKMRWRENFYLLNQRNIGTSFYSLNNLKQMIKYYIGVPNGAGANFSC